MPLLQSKTTIEPSTPPKSAILAAVISLLIPGVGQIYLGQTTKGLIILAASILLSWIGIGFVIWIAGIVDAYLIGQKLEQGQSVGDMQFFWES